MRRRLLVLLVVSVMLALLIPATASAASWVVKNRSGTKLGRVAKVAKKKCVFYDRNGRRCGFVVYNRYEVSFQAYYGYASDMEPRKWAWVPMIVAYHGYCLADSSMDVFGYSDKKNGKWVAKKLSSRRVVGRVSASCPQWGAVSAVYVLTKNWR